MGKPTDSQLFLANSHGRFTEGAWVRFTAAGRERQGVLRSTSDGGWRIESLGNQCHFAVGTGISDAQRSSIRRG